MRWAIGVWRWPLLAVGVLFALWLVAPVLLRPPASSCERLDRESSDLVVLLHAFNKSSADLVPLREVADQALDRPDVLTCDLPFDTLSMARPEEVVRDLLAAMDDAWTTKESSGRQYQRIFLVGHSMGALFARKMYIVAAGETPDAPFERELEAALGVPAETDVLLPRRPWASAVDRVVLLAGLNRGWSISHHMSLSRAAAYSAGAALGRVLEWRFDRYPLIFSIRRGSPFITDLRIQWLEMRRRARESNAPGNALTVQLLGSIDDLVSPEDNLDLVSGRDFYYLDVPLSGHADVVEMKSRPEPPPKEITREQRAEFERAAAFMLALAAGHDEMALKGLRPVDLGQAAPTCRPEEPGVETHVLFVIHGIRDQGFWTKKIARKVQARAEDRILVVPETSTYGYFPMLPFLKSRARMKKVEWLMDRYTEARACYPDAKFHYVGHSNGTYLLAKALDMYPSCRFDRVVFAGSVVRTDYDWPAAIARGQVESVLNFVASNDLVVAIFPNTFEQIGWQDLGGAGHGGFKEGAVEAKSPDGEKLYVEGGHAAALDEDLWDAIAAFVIDDVAPAEFSDRLIADRKVQALLVAEQAGLASLLGRIAPLVPILILLLLAAGAYGLTRLPIREWTRTVILIGYLVLIWMVLTRV